VGANYRELVFLSQLFFRGNLLRNPQLTGYPESLMSLFKFARARILPCRLALGKRLAP
jgi:hypothetical protein